MSRSPRCAVAVLVICLAWVGPARSEGGNTSALDLVYEAADSIDGARDEIAAGRQREADRLLTRAERFLDEAARLDPALRRVDFERARLLQTDGDPSRAEALLLTSMTGPLAPSDQVRAVGILDGIRGDLGRPSVGESWRRATIARDVGLIAVAAGTLTSLLGFVIGFDALAQDTYQRLDRPDLGPRQAGLGVALTGAVLGGAGVGVALGGEFGRRGLRLVLPGPWRLPGGGLENGSSRVAKPPREAPERERW